MKLHIYPASRCYHSLSDLFIAPFISSRNFDRFFEKWLDKKPYLCTYRARNAIYQILVYLKRNFNVTRVLIPAYICKEAMTPVKMSGLDIVIVDSNLETLGIDLKKIDLRPNDVVICPNLFGLKTDIKRLYGKKIFIIEDNASSFIKPSPYADFTIYSFGKGKEISSSEGGLIVIGKKKFESLLEESKLFHPGIKFEILRYFEYFLWKLKTYRIIYFLGKKIKSRISKSKGEVIVEREIEGRNFSICRISKNLTYLQLKKIEELRQESKKLVELFIKQLKKFNDISILAPPENSNCFYLNLFIENRDSLKCFLEKKHIFTSIYWSYLSDIVNKKCYRNFSYILNHILQILINPNYMKKEDVYYILENISEWKESVGRNLWK